MFSLLFSVHKSKYRASTFFVNDGVVDDDATAITIFSDVHVFGISTIFDRNVITSFCLSVNDSILW